MEVKGKIIVDLGEQGGVSQAGNQWKKHEYVLETVEARPRKIHFDFFGDRADQFPLHVGDDVTLSFDIESREYNGRWFTSIRGWKAEMSGATTSQTATQQIHDNIGVVNKPPVPDGLNRLENDSENEDLPF